MVNERKLNNIQINTPCGSTKIKAAEKRLLLFSTARFHAA